MTTNCHYEGSKEITNPSVHARATGRHGSTAGHLGGGVGQADLDEGAVCLAWCAGGFKGDSVKGEGTVVEYVWSLLQGREEFQNVLKWLLVDLK